MELKFNSVDEVREFMNELDPAKSNTVEDRLASALAEYVTASYPVEGGRIGKIASIKIYRTAMQCSIKEAKEAIERYVR